MTEIHPSAEIHPTAIVSEGAQIGADTKIGPYSVIGENVKIGQECVLYSHVVVDGHTTIGNKNTIFQFASVGAAPQDLKFKGEPSELIIGYENIIREYSTLQPGTEGGGMKTVIGNKNLFMVYSHVGHDGIVGDRNIFANAATLAGHVTVGNGVVIGGLSAVHQFVKLGDLAMVGGGAMVNKDLPPFVIAQGDRAELVGINSIGLERAGFSEDQVKSIKRAYRAIFYSETTLAQSLESALAEFKSDPESIKFLEFIARSERGVTPVRKKGREV